jgi:serine/threonine protein kinase
MRWRVKSKKEEAADFPHEIGRYLVRSSIGRGGMGEVYRCWDPHFCREVAVKRIRPDLVGQARIRHRFLREARIAGQLSHPSIIPVYELNEESDPFYVMPHLAGRSFRSMLQAPLSDVPPIPGLLRVFLQICQAVAYAHSRGILHRDLKPENVIVGHFGEVVLLDWGLAKTATDVEVTAESPDVDSEVTSFGKIVGTLAYMAPERTLKQPATVLTEIYALGVILYQILCGRLPFKRKNFKEFRKSVHRERFEDPSKIAPLREVPAQLVRIVKRCLHPIPTRRYNSVEALISDVQTVLEGRSDWFPTAELSIHNKADWEFQEHVWLAPMVGIGPSEASEWVGLMISKGSFSGNVRIETSIRLKPKSRGIGFLLSVPEASERLYPDDGYLVWLGGAESPGFRLFRRHALVLEKEELMLPADGWIPLVIEKIDNAIRVILGDLPVLSYLSHLPLHGTHIGVLHRDADFDVSQIKVSTGSASATQSCLALPDALLSYGEYARALAEYRRIAYSFPERSEGREAIFRAGLTLIEKARHAAHPKQKEALESQARSEFERLKGTPSAPLEYLGKALIAQSQGFLEEELQYLELALRRYPLHPLTALLEEQISHRLAEVARVSRPATIQYLGLIARMLPEWLSKPHIASVLKHVHPSFPLPCPGGVSAEVLIGTALCQAERVSICWPQDSAATALVVLDRLDLAPELPAFAAPSWHHLIASQLRGPLVPSLNPWCSTLSQLLLAYSEEQRLQVSFAASMALLRRAQDRAWSLDATFLPRDLSSWPRDAQRSILQAELWLALALCDLDKAMHCEERLNAFAPDLPGSLLHACLLARQHHQAEAESYLGRSEIHHVAEGLALTDPALLAWRSITGSLTENAWNRALPLEQREALRWIRLWALVRDQSALVEAIQRTLESKEWGRLPFSCQ